MVDYITGCLLNPFYTSPEKFLNGQKLSQICAALRLHGSCGTKQRNIWTAMKVCKVLTWSQDGQNFLPRCRFRFSQTGVNTWTGHVFAQFARKPSYAHLISRTLVNNTTCNSNFTAPCKWLAQVKNSSAQKFVHTPLNQAVSNLPDV